MLTVSNGLSLCRAPLALLFLQENVFLRVLAIALAMFTDSIDGYLARRSCSTSRFGAVLDPAMDKFFVYFVLCVMHAEGRIGTWQAAAMLSRDVAVLAYGLAMVAARYWRSIEIKAIRWGKITTALQFVVLIGAALGLSFSSIVYGTFILMGFLAFLELSRISSLFKKLS